MISVDEAKKIFEDVQSTCVASEEIELKDANARILATDIRAKANIPDFDNSAMDGFACNVKYLHEHCRTGLPIAIIEEVAAGDAPSILNTSSPTAVRIFTGAPIPKGANCVVPVENCIVENDNLFIREEFRDLKKYCKKNQHIRPRGLNFMKDELVLEKGSKLGSMNITVLASLGLQKIQVYKKLKVAIGITGDELVSNNNAQESSQEVPLGKIHDSNTSLLRHLCIELGFDIVMCSHINDTLQATQDFLSSAAQKADVILSSGGISMGEKDFIKIALQDKSIFEILFQTLALKPGKPFTFARYRNDANDANKQSAKHTPILAMPGNPLSVFITFMYFAVPYMYALAGKANSNIQLETLASPSSFSEHPRTRFLFAIKEDNKIILLHEQGSAAIKNLRNTQGALIIPAHKNIKEDTKLAYFPFNQFIHL